MSLAELLKKYPNDEAAEEFFVQQRWPEGVACPKCGNCDVQDGANHPEMRFRCRGCWGYFSVRTGTTMERSKLGCLKWLMAAYLLMANRKGISSIRLGEELGVPQSTAWFLAHRIREGWHEASVAFEGVVEVDETFIGGLEKNKHWSKKIRNRERTGERVLGEGKTVVVGIREQKSGRVHAKHLSKRENRNVGAFVRDNTCPDAILHTDEWMGYRTIPRLRYFISHAEKEFVRGAVTTNGIESLWACLKRSYRGTYHLMSRRHLQRYVDECCGRLNMRGLKLEDKLGRLIRGMDGKSLNYAALTAPDAETFAPRIIPMLW
ncbi:MAG: IS1595 family transposase [Candidatus Tectomicrobia bacterium]|nr:IS1595 family transposase [Candidatus Tectomicrobia bacterium]